MGRFGSGGASACARNSCDFALERFGVGHHLGDAGMRAILDWLAGGSASSSCNSLLAVDRHGLRLGERARSVATSEEASLAARARRKPPPMPHPRRELSEADAKLMTMRLLAF